LQFDKDFYYNFRAKKLKGVCMKKLKAFFAWLMVMPIMAFAGTQDNLGVQGVWDTVYSWIEDGYLQKIIALIFFVIGVMRATQSILQFFIMLGFAVLIFNAGTIIEKLAAATF